MFMRSQYTHESLPKCQYQTKKIKNIKNEKYCTHSYIHALTSLLARFILRPAWCGHDLNLSFFKKNRLRPSLHYEGLHLIEK